MNDISNSTSPAAIAAATASPSPAPAPATAVEAPVIPSAASAAAESPVVATPANNTTEPKPVEPSVSPLVDARPAQELQATFLDEGAEPLPPAKDAPVEPAQPETAPAEKEIAPVEAAPIVYEFAYPEGFSAENLDQERFTEFTTLLNETKVPPEKAQKYMDMHLQEVQRARISALDDVWQSYHKQQNDWKTRIRDDREFGGDNLPTSKAQANAFIEQYGGSPEEQAQLRRDLFQTGAGNSPALVKAMIRAGQSLSREGRPVISPPPRQAPPSRQQRGLQRYSGTAGSS